MLGQRFENKVGSIINLSINFIAVCNFDKLKGESRKRLNYFHRGETIRLLYDFNRDLLKILLLFSVTSIHSQQRIARNVSSLSHFFCSASTWISVRISNVISLLSLNCSPFVGKEREEKE